MQWIKGRKSMMRYGIDLGKIKIQPITACKQYCLAAGATQGNIAYTQTVSGHSMDDHADTNGDAENRTE